MVFQNHSGKIRNKITLKTFHSLKKKEHNSSLRTSLKMNYEKVRQREVGFVKTRHVNVEQKFFKSISSVGRFLYHYLNNRYTRKCDMKSDNLFLLFVNSRTKY